jgi:hypothetical protein
MMRYKMQGQAGELAPSLKDIPTIHVICIEPLELVDER